MDLERTILNTIVSCEVLIYAPPGYGKTRFANRNRHHDQLCDLFETDRLRKECHMPNHWHMVLTNVPSLIPHANLSIAFLPSREQFISGCKHQGLEFKEQWYQDALHYCRSATYVITTGDSLTFYQRFILKAIDHYFDGEAPIAVPTFKPGYTPDPVYPPSTQEFDESRLVVKQETVSSDSSSSWISHRNESSSVDESNVFPVETRVSDVSIEIKTLSHSDICYDICAHDTEPTPRCAEASKLLVDRLNICTVPYEFYLDNVPSVYYGGNLVLFGRVFISVNLLLSREHRNRIINRVWQRYVPMGALPIHYGGRPPSDDSPP